MSTDLGIDTSCTAVSDCAPTTISTRLHEKTRTTDATPFLHLIQHDAAPQTLTYDQVVEEACRWSNLYRERGVAPGDRVVIVLPHSADLYAAIVGTLLIGAVPAVFAFPSPKFSERAYFRTIGALLDNADPQVLVVYPELRTKLDQAGHLTGSIQVCGAGDLPAHAPGRPPPPETDADAIAVLQYSSGTTGLKKGVALSHRALLRQLDDYAAAIRLTRDDTIVSWLPLYHDMGLIACFFLPLIKNVPLVALSPFDWVRRPALWLQAVTRYGGTLSWFPNFAYSFMADNVNDADLGDVDLSSLRGVVNCSEPIMAGSQERFLDRFRVFHLRPEALCSCYAMAENVFAVTSGGFGEALPTDRIDGNALARTGRAVPLDRSSPDAKVMVSSGRALRDTDIDIVSPDASVLPDRHVGEIVLTSPCLLTGYHRNPEATARSVRNGAYHTGDLGYLVDGELYVTGRCKDLIIVAGRNLYPQDIEAQLRDIPGLIAGRNVALGVPDTALGTEQLVILAETNESLSGQQNTIRDEIRKCVIATTDVTPGDIQLVPHGWLLKSSSGKIARAANRDRYRAELADAVPHEPEPHPAAEVADLSPAERVLRCVQDVLRCKRVRRAATIGVDDPLITSGLIDSLTLVSIILEIETEFGVLIPTHCLDLSNYNTAASIAAMIHRLRAEGSAPRRIPVTPYTRAMSLRDRKCLDFRRSGRAFDALILGSSRAMPLHTSILRTFGYEAFNFTIYSARAEDWYCIVRFVQDHAPTPLRLIILGLDVEAFSNATPVDIRLVHSPHLAGHLDPQDRATDPRHPCDDARSFSRLDRFDRVLRQFQEGAARGFAESWEPSTGDYVRPNDEAFTRRERLQLRAPLDSLPEYTMRMRNFTCLDPRRLDYFTRFCDLCRDAGTEVVSFVMPLHPELDRMLRAKTMFPQRAQDLLAYLETLQTSGLRFQPTFVPSDFGGDDDDFIDGAHPGAHNADVLLRTLMQGDITSAEVASAWRCGAGPLPSPGRRFMPGTCPDRVSGTAGNR